MIQLKFVQRKLVQPGLAELLPVLTESYLHARALSVTSRWGSAQPFEVAKHLATSGAAPRQPALLDFG